MTLLIEAVILGILSGGVYALMASGLTLIFGVMDIINVAMGILVILGAYLSWVLEQALHIDPVVSLVLTMPTMFIIGVALELSFIRRIARDRTSLSILVTFATALLIEGVLTFLFSTDYVQLHTWYVDATFGVAGFYLSYFDVITFALSMILLAGLYLLVYSTTFGSSLRASMQNRTAAALVGIDVERVQAITFGIGTSLAAVGGVAFGATSLFNPASSYDLIYRLVVIIVLGGLGSLRGALIASLVMLVVGSVTAVLWSATWSNLVFFVLLVMLLVFRPQGLFGRPEERKQ